MISGPVKIMKTTLVNVHFMLGSKMFNYLEYSEILQSIEWIFKMGQFIEMHQNSINIKWFALNLK